MLFYVQSGSINVTLLAHSHKQAAMRIVRKEKDLGKFVIVGLEEIKEDSASSQMFFHTDSLLNEKDKCLMRLVN
jgi:hypothetical protein